MEKTVKGVLEHYFQKHKSRSREEITFLAESLQLEKKVVSNWFKNRKQKEKRKLLASRKPITDMSQSKTVGQIRSTEVLSTQSKNIRNPNPVDLSNLPLNLSNGPITRNVKRFSLGKPSGATQHRTVLVLGTGVQIQQIFINKIVNYIINVNDEDNFRFLVDENGTRHSNCLSVYDIHHAEGFRIPYSLTIVVTPYSGDWEEQLFRDQRVAEMFREFTEAKDGIKELDMICNVTVETGGIKQPFLSIFGKDVEENINNWNLSVNFLSGSGPWQAVVQHFFAVLAIMKTAPLLLTKLVLYERKKMEEVVYRLQTLVTSGLSKLQEVNAANQKIAYCDAQLRIEQELIFNSWSSTASASCTCPEQFSVYSDNRSVVNFACCREICIKQEPSILWCDNQNYCDHQSYYGEETKWADIRSKGHQLVKVMQNDLLKNGRAIRGHLKYIWRCIHRLNKFALHGNSFSNQKVFELLYDAEQHLKQLNF